MEDILVPISMFAVVGIIVWLVVFFRFRTRSEMQKTVRLALDKGAELSPEVIEQLSGPKSSQEKDLRSGLIWLSIGIALALCGVFVPDPSGHAMRGCLAGAVFPAMIGLAYLVMWQYTSRKEAR